MPLARHNRHRPPLRRRPPSRATHVSPRPTPCAVVSTTNPVRSGESERRGQGIAAAANLVRSGASLATILSIVVALQRRHHATAHRPHCRPPRLFRHAARAGAMRKADDPWFKALVRKSAGRRVLFVGDRCEPPHAPRQTDIGEHYYLQQMAEELRLGFRTGGDGTRWSTKPASRPNAASVSSWRSSGAARSHRVGQRKHASALVEPRRGFRLMVSTRRLRMRWWYQRSVPRRHCWR